MSAATGAVLAVLCVLILATPRRVALCALTAGLLYLTQGHAFDLAGFAMMPNRVLVTVGFLRVLARKEWQPSMVTATDLRLVLLYSFVTIILLLRPDEPIAARIARFTDTTFAYFAFKGLLSNAYEVRTFLRMFAYMLIPYVLLLIPESLRLGNQFTIFGGNTVTWLRENAVRCFGSFRHPSLLGSLGATFFPVYLGMSIKQEDRRIAFCGCALSVLIVFFSSSGGPVSAFATGMVAWVLWFWRAHMRKIRWTALACLVLLAMLMKAPVWYLIARVSNLTGGSGWHRSYLIEVSVRHFEKWWLFGIPLRDTHGWFPYNLASTGGADVTNQYIAYGFQAGIVAIALFLAYITRLFKLIGEKIQQLTLSGGAVADATLTWGLGAMLAAHVFNWLGITYWDQFHAFWLLQMAMIATWAEQIPPVSEGITSYNPPIGHWKEQFAKENEGLE